MKAQKSFVSSRLAALALCAFAYLYVSPSYPAINNPNENVRLYMTAAIVEEGRFEIDSFRQRWGYVNDAATRDGHIYSVKAPGVSYLALPGYAAYRQVQALRGAVFDRDIALWICRVTATVIPTLMWLWWFYSWLARRSEHAGLVAAVFFSVALGSLLYGYGLLLVSHTHSAIAASGAFMLLSDARESGQTTRMRAFFAGLLVAGVTWFEYPGLPCSLVLAVYGLYALRGWPKRAWFCVGGALPALSMMHFQWRAFGSPLTPGHLMVENASFRAAHHEGLYGAVGISGKALYGLLIEPGAGLFPLTPVLLLALPGLWLLARDKRTRPEAWCLGLCALLTVMVIAAMNNWRGGWTIGPRYLALVVPLLASPALLALDRWASQAQRQQQLHVHTLALALTVVAMLASGLPSVYYPHLPPEIDRPLAQLLTVLIAHGYAPHNAAGLIGIYGNASMVALALCALLALVMCGDAAEASAHRFRGWAPGCVLGVVLGVALSLPLWHAPTRGRNVADAVAFITRRWSPDGHDDAALLRAQLKRTHRVSNQDLLALAALYEAEGRTSEAARARAGKP